MTILSNELYTLTAGVIRPIVLPHIAAAHASISYFVYSRTGDLELLETPTSIALDIPAAAGVWKAGPFRLNAGAPLYVRSATNQNVQIIAMRDEASTALSVGPSTGPRPQFEFLDDLASETSATVDGRFQLTFDGLGPTTERRFGSGFYDVNTQKIIAENVGDAYELRVNVDLDRLTSGVDELVFEVQIEAPSPIIIASNIRAASDPQDRTYSIVFPLFCLEAFVEYGAGIYLTTLGGAFDMSNLSLYLRKI